MFLMSCALCNCTRIMTNVSSLPFIVYHHHCYSSSSLSSSPLSSSSLLIIVVIHHHRYSSSSLFSSSLSLTYFETTRKHEISNIVLYKNRVTISNWLAGHQLLSIIFLKTLITFHFVIYYFLKLRIAFLLFYHSNLLAKALGFFVF